MNIVRLSRISRLLRLVVAYLSKGECHRGDYEGVNFYYLTIYHLYASYIFKTCTKGPRLHYVLPSFG